MTVEDGRIIGLFFAREEQALDETKKKYGSYCFTVANGIHEVENIRPYLISYCESEEYLNELLN